MRLAGAHSTELSRILLKLSKSASEPNAAPNRSSLARQHKGGTKEMMRTLVILELRPRFRRESRASSRG
jgi:hypothetical protein